MCTISILQKKTEVIKKLEQMIPAKKELSYPSSEEDEDQTTSKNRVKDKINSSDEIMKLRIENERIKEEHARELSQLKKANDKIINDYR